MPFDSIDGWLILASRLAFIISLFIDYADYWYDSHTLPFPLHFRRDAYCFAFATPYLPPLVDAADACFDIAISWVSRLMLSFHAWCWCHDELLWCRTSPDTSLFAWSIDADFSAAFQLPHVRRRQSRRYQLGMRWYYAMPAPMIFYVNFMRAYDAWCFIIRAHFSLIAPFPELLHELHFSAAYDTGHRYALHFLRRATLHAAIFSIVLMPIITDYAEVLPATPLR